MGHPVVKKIEFSVQSDRFHCTFTVQSLIMITIVIIIVQVNEKKAEDTSVQVQSEDRIRYR